MEPIDEPGDELTDEQKAKRDELAAVAPEPVPDAEGLPKDVRDGTIEDD